MMEEQNKRFEEARDWKHLEKVEMDFLDRAELKCVVEAETCLPIQAVWDAFVEPDSWQYWFPKVECAFYIGDKPYGAGITRRSIVDGILYDETLLVWDEPKRWGYRIDRATLGISKAHIEMTEFETLDSGTRVIWTLAFDPLYEIDQAQFSGFLKKLLDEALEGLEKFC